MSKNREIEYQNIYVSVFMTVPIDVDTETMVMHQGQNFSFVYTRLVTPKA